MTDNVCELRPGDLSIVGDDVVVDPERVIETSKGRFQKVFVVGIENGELIVKGSHNHLEAHWYLTKALRDLEGCYNPD